VWGDELRGVTSAASSPLERRPVAVVALVNVGARREQPLHLKDEAFTL
jgi:hypothetical protein